eukprot:GHVQ01032967.1.p1 GENE.GHVQ01032967.1~~GHVQ01032967.1.p1  ORF type:complete len:429 (+),score=48.40 GHVQ01032967.1:620-1906(+)
MLTWFMCLLLQSNSIREESVRHDADSTTISAENCVSEDEEDPSSSFPSAFLTSIQSTPSLENPTQNRSQKSSNILGDNRDISTSRGAVQIGGDSRIARIIRKYSDNRNCQKPQTSSIPLETSLSVAHSTYSLHSTSSLPHLETVSLNSDQCSNTVSSNLSTEFGPSYELDYLSSNLPLMTMEYNNSTSSAKSSTSGSRLCDLRHLVHLTERKLKQEKKTLRQLQTSAASVQDNMSRLHSNVNDECLSPRLNGSKDETSSSRRGSSLRMSTQSALREPRLNYVCKSRLTDYEPSSCRKLSTSFSRGPSAILRPPTMQALPAPECRTSRRDVVLRDSSPAMQFSAGLQATSESSSLMSITNICSLKQRTEEETSCSRARCSGPGTSLVNSRLSSSHGPIPSQAPRNHTNMSRRLSMLGDRTAERVTPHQT